MPRTVPSVLRSGWRELTHRPASQLPALDALRSIAVLLVIASHYALPEWLPRAKGPEIGMRHWPMFNYGWTGVDLFFVLSGLLIGTQLWRELKRDDTINVRRFIVKRGFRIWPLYFAVLALLALSGYDIRWPDWTFLVNYHDTFYSRSWSLSTEEQFYIIVPLLVLATRRIWPIVALIAMIPVMRYWERGRLLGLGMAPATVHERMLNPIHLHAEGLLIGLVLAWITVHRPQWIAPTPDQRVSKRGLAVLVAGVMLGLALDVANKELFSFTALGLIFGAVTYFALVDQSWLTRPLRANWCYPISRLSYGMYLIHFVLLPGSTAWAIAHLPGPLPAVFVGGLLIGTAIAISGATVTFLLVEHPFLLWRARWLDHTRARVPADVQAATP